jgi:hypothetical protein
MEDHDRGEVVDGARVEAIITGKTRNERSRRERSRGKGGDTHAKPRADESI